MEFEGRSYNNQVMVTTFHGTPQEVDKQVNDWFAKPEVDEVVKTAHCLYVTTDGKFHSTATMYFVKRVPKVTR